LSKEQPFNAYYVTISGHQPYGNGNSQSVKHMSTFASTTYSDAAKAYLGTCIELDKAMEYLLQRLESAGIADKTLVVLVPDHIPYFDVATISELAGKEFARGDSSDLANSLDESMITDYDLYKSTLIMWTGSMEEAVEIDKVCCQVDVLPTISNLLGLEYDSRMLAGSDILSDSMGLVIFNSGCWLTDAGYYDRYETSFTLHEGISMSEADQESYVSAMKKLVNNKRSIAEVIIDYDAYEYIFPGTKNSSSLAQ